MSDSTTPSAAGIPGLEYDPVGNRLLFNGEIIALGGESMTDATSPAAGGIPGLEYDAANNKLLFNGTEVGTGGTVTITLPNPTVAQTTPASPYKKLVTRGAPSSGTLVNWDLAYRESGSPTWIPYLSGISAATTAQEVADLSANKTYEFQTIGHVTLPYTTPPSVGTGTTDPAPTQDTTLRNHLYMSFQAGSLNAQNYASVASVSYQNTTIPLAPTNNWTTMEVIMFDILGAPVAPQGIWACVGDGVGGADYPDYNSAVTWVAATGLKAPPAGSDDSPGIGPVCNPIAIPPSAGKRAITIRIQMPAGNYTGASLSTTTSLYPVGQVKPLLQSASIAGNPGISSGWGESFGVCPAIMIKLNGLTTPISMWAAVGDSHTQGYLGSGSAYTGVRGMFGEFVNVWAGNYPKFYVMNFGRSGHTKAQIGSRVRALNSALDIGGWLIQEGSINDRTVDPDITLAIANATWAQNQSDHTYITGFNKRCIFYGAFGANSTFPAGWYTRYRSRHADVLALQPHTIEPPATVVQADGSYQAGMNAPDNGHPNQTGTTQAGVTEEPAVRTMLTSEGIAF